jgi:hypothetical protein
MSALSTAFVFSRSRRFLLPRKSIGVYNKGMTTPTNQTESANASIEIMDANWSGDDVLLTCQLTDGERCTDLTVRASTSWDRVDRAYDVTLHCERILGIRISDEPQVLANNFVGAELELTVLAHDAALTSHALRMRERADRQERLGRSYDAMVGRAV